MTQTNTYGKLYLIPTLLGGDDIERCIPPYNLKIIDGLRYFIVEEIRSARRFLRKAISTFPIDECDFQTLNEHTNTNNINNLLYPIYQGHNVGLLSEAGLPCIADPGSELVILAQQKNITIIPLVGATSVLMALMASGLTGQNFVFHGYLPTDKQALITKLQQMNTYSQKHKQSQIFIETPYRNNQLIDTLLKTCSNSTLLCIATNITLPNEFIVTKTIAEWKSKPLPDFHKQPTIFILQN